MHKQERSKLDPKSKSCLFMGFKGVKGYKLWDLVQKKMFVSRDVIFDKKPLLDKKLEEKKSEGTVPCQKDTVEAVGELQECRPREEEPHEQVAEDADDTVVEQQEEYSIARGRESRNHRPPVRYGFEDMLSFSLISSDGFPLSYEEAVRSSEKERWMEAMVEELESLKKNNTWELVQLPKDKMVVGCKWVYGKKEVVSEKDIEKYKARLWQKGTYRGKESTTTKFSHL